MNDYGTPTFNRSASFGKQVLSDITVSSYNSGKKMKRENYKDSQYKENQYKEYKEQKENQYNEQDNQYKENQYKDNQFLRIAEKSLQTPHQPIKTPIVPQYDDLISKITKLDEENRALRELLKRSNYHSLHRSDIQVTKMEDQLSNSTQNSFDTDDQYSPKHHKKPNKQKMLGLAVQQVIQQRQTKLLAKQYESDSFILNPSADDCLYCEFYKDLVMRIIKKDTAIFEGMEATIQKEMNTNYYRVVQNQIDNNALYVGLVGTVESLTQSMEGKSDYSQVITFPFNLNKSYKDLQLVLHKTKQTVHQYKVLLQHLKRQEKRKQGEMVNLFTSANEELQVALMTIQTLTQQNKRLNDQSKQNYPLQPPPLEQDLMQHIEQLKEKFNHLYQKYVRNKEKFKFLLQDILKSLNIDQVFLNINQLHEQIINALHQK